MSRKPSSSSNMHKGLMAVALVGLGLCVLGLFKGGRTGDTTTETIVRVESASPSTTPVPQFETMAVATPKEMAESRADQLMALIRECLTSWNGSATEFGCSSEWVELINTDVFAAMRILEEVEERAQREQLLALLLKHWAQFAGTSALNWAAQLPDLSERDLALRAAITGVVEADPSLAVAFTEQNFAGEQREILLQEIGRQWAARNFDEALTWIQARPADENRDKLFFELAFVSAKTNPEQAARLVVEKIPPGVIQANAALSVVAQWAQTDFAAATEWVNRFPESQTRDHAVLQLGRSAFYHSWRPALEGVSAE